MFSLTAQIRPSEQASTWPLYAYTNKVTPFHRIVPSLISGKRLLPGGWLHVLPCLFSQQPQTWCQNPSPQHHTMSLLTPFWWYPSPTSSLSSPPPPAPPQLTLLPFTALQTPDTRLLQGFATCRFAPPGVLSPASLTSLPCLLQIFTQKSPS